MTKKFRIFFSNFNRSTTLKELYKFFEGLVISQIKICVYESTKVNKQEGCERYGLLILFSEDDYNFILEKTHYQLNDKVQITVSAFQKRRPEKRGINSSVRYREEERGDYTPQKSHDSLGSHEDQTQAESIDDLKNKLANQFQNQNYEEFVRSQKQIGKDIPIPESYTISEMQEQISKSSLLNNKGDPRKICIGDVPAEMSISDLRKKMISFGKVENLALIDRNGIDYGEFHEKRNSLKNEAELCYKLLIISGSQSRTGLVEYKWSEEANKALLQQQIKVKKDSTLVMRFLTIPDRLSFFLQVRYPEDSTTISGSSQGIGPIHNKNPGLENPENMMIRKTEQKMEYSQGLGYHENSFPYEDPNYRPGQTKYLPFLPTHANYQHPYSSTTTYVFQNSDFMMDHRSETIDGTFALDQEFYRRAYMKLHQPGQTTKTISRKRKIDSSLVLDQNEGSSNEMNSESSSQIGLEPRVLELFEGKKMEFMDSEESIPILRLITDQIHRHSNHQLQLDTIVARKCNHAKSNVKFGLLNPDDHYDIIKKLRAILDEMNE